MNKFAPGKSRGGGFVLSDYITFVLQQIPEFPYRERGSLKDGKRDGWMLWYIPGDKDGKANIKNRFENGSFKELTYDPTSCKKCGSKTYKTYKRVSLNNGKLITSASCYGCSIIENQSIEDESNYESFPDPWEPRSGCHWWWL